MIIICKYHRQYRNRHILYRLNCMKITCTLHFPVKCSLAYIREENIIPV